MQAILGLAFLYLLSFAKSATVRRKRIINPDKCSLSLESYMVAVVSPHPMKGNHLWPRFQGGVPVTHQYVITTDSFSEGEYSQTIYVIRNPNTSKKVDVRFLPGEWYSVVRVYQAKERRKHYRDVEGYYKHPNIVILQLRNPLPTSQKLPKFPTSREFVSNCDKLIMVGWGQTEPPDPGEMVANNKYPSAEIHCGNLKAVTFESCAERYPGLVPVDTFRDDFLCTSNRQTVGFNADKCFLDEGGPIFCGQVLVGIINDLDMSTACGDRDEVSMHLRIDNPTYANFIYATTGRRFSFQAEMVRKNITTKRPPPEHIEDVNEGIIAPDPPELHNDHETFRDSGHLNDDYWNVDMNMTDELNAAQRIGFFYRLLCIAAFCSCFISQ